MRHIIYTALLLAAATGTATAQTELQIVKAGEKIDFEGNKGAMPSTVAAKEDINGLDKVTFSGDKMTFHRGSLTTDYTVTDVEKVSVSGNINKMSIFYPPSVSSLLNFETGTDTSLDMDYTAGKKTDSFSATNNESINASQAGTLSPTSPTIYTLTGSNTNGAITITGSQDVMILLDGADLRSPNGPSIINEGSGKLYVATKKGTVNTLTGIASKSSGAVYLSGEGLLRILASTDNVAAIRSVENINIGGGTLNIFASGYCGQGIYSDKNVNITAGAINIITTGDGTQEDAKLGFQCAAAICAGTDSNTDGTINITNAKVRIKAIGGVGALGLGAMHKITLKNSTIVLSTFDDGMNAVDEIQSTDCDIFSTSAVDDGIGGSGAFIFRGGKMYVCAPYPNEGAFDNNGKNFAIENNITLIGLGARRTDSPMGYKSTVPSIYLKDVTAGKYLIVKDSSGKDVISFITPQYPGPFAFTVASPKLQPQTGYEVYTSDKCTSGTESWGIIENGVFEDIQKVTNATSSEVH